MKKLLFISILSIFGLTTAHAQYNNDVEWGLFNHMSVGLGLGTTGISVDVAAPICPYVAIRAGADILPDIKFRPALDLGFNQEIKDFVYEWFNECKDGVPEQYCILGEQLNAELEKMLAQPTG